ncbi:hypothetical protein V5799_016638 [Amblyomma americanum]|uniref:Basic proline-rich protein-like n=1 Tax=Amblyomma americanum TaxID=6943 RepID=A0AAQ4F4G4_AMBAM
MALTLYCIFVLLAFAAPSESVRPPKPQNKGPRPLRPLGQRPPNPPTQGAQRPQGHGLPPPRGPRPVPPPGNMHPPRQGPVFPPPGGPMYPPASGPMHPRPGGPMLQLPGGPGGYPHPSLSYQNPQRPWVQKPTQSYPQGPPWRPPTKNICPVMCQPGQKPGDPCGPVPNCLCALDLRYGSMSDHPCIFVPSG